MRRLACLLLVAAALVAGCGHPLIPQSVVAAHQTVKAHAKAAAAAKATAAASPTAAPPVSRVAQIGANGPVVGVNLYATSNYSAAQTQADGIRMMSYIKNDLHAGAVDIVWNFYASNDSSNTVLTDSTTLTADNVAILTQIAQEYHLLVAYRPLMFVHIQNTWEGNIKPANSRLWFDSYYNQNLPYLRMAQRYHVAEYIIGTEMDGVIGNALWPGFIARSNQVYQGVVSYAAHEYLYFPPKHQIPNMQYLGVDMYEKMNIPASSSQARVTQNYESWFAKMPASELRRTAIIETGISGVDGAYGSPSNLNLTGNMDPVIQQRWFTAACQAVKKFQLRAVFFWKVNLADMPLTHPASTPATFEGRLGAQAIAACASIING
jgi:hypothetical protein